MKHWKAILVVVGIFALGMAAGSLITVRVAGRAAHRPQAVEEMVVRRLSRRLDLDQTQQAQVREIVRAGREELRPLRREMAAVLEQSVVKTRAILRPGQVEKFDKLVADRRAQWAD